VPKNKKSTFYLSPTGAGVSTFSKESPQMVADGS